MATKGATIHHRCREKLMKTAEDIESYLIQLDAQFESIKEGVWLVKDLGPDLVISITDTLLVFRMKVMEIEKIPATQREAFFKKLLQLNTTEMVHGAYGLEHNFVVITDALQLENLDLNEFQATLDDIGMAASNHYSDLSTYTA
jgi:hypothetical protein